MEKTIRVLTVILFLALFVSIILVVKLWSEKEGLVEENNRLKIQLEETQRYMYELWTNYTKLEVENKVQLELIHSRDYTIENLTSTLNNITITLSEYTSLPLSFKRVLTLDEVLATNGMLKQLVLLRLVHGTLIETSIYGYLRVLDTPMTH